MKNLEEKITKAWKIVIILALNTVMLMLFSALSEKESISVISPGANGEEVRLLQEKLRESGYYKGQPDGGYSLEVRRAIKDFQEEKGIPATGKADCETLFLLGLNCVHSDYFSVEVQLAAKYIQWKCGGKSYAEKLKAGEKLINKLSLGASPDSVSEFLFLPEYVDFYRSTADIIPDCASHKAAYVCLNRY